MNSVRVNITRVWVYHQGLVRSCEHIYTYRHTHWKQSETHTSRSHIESISSQVQHWKRKAVMALLEEVLTVTRIKKDIQIYDNFRQYSRGFGRYVLDKIIHTLYMYTVWTHPSWLIIWYIRSYKAVKFTIRAWSSLGFRPSWKSSLRETRKKVKDELPCSE